MGAKHSHRWRRGFARSQQQHSRSTVTPTLVDRRRLRFESLEARRLLAVFTVDNLNDAGAGSLRDAIAVANSTPGADEIQFSTTGVIGLTSGELEITEELIITGPGQELLAIDAQQNSRVINFTATTGDLDIVGLTLQNGRTTGDNDRNDFIYSGGGIRFLSGGALTLTNTSLHANSTNGVYARGGGIYVSTGTVTLTGSSVRENFTTGFGASGGSIYSPVGVVALDESVISGNRTEGNEARGGGVAAGSGGVVLNDSTVSGNSTAADDASGGGIATFSGDVLLNGSIVSGNSTAEQAASGGGIATFGGDVLLTDSVVSGNSTTGYRWSFGGGVSTSSGDVTLVRSSVTGNSTAGFYVSGGGISTVSGVVTLTDSLVTGNRTYDGYGDGVGIATATGNISLARSTLSDNRALGAGSDGAGIFTLSGEVEIVDSTISGNMTTMGRSVGGGIYSKTGPISISNSTVSGNRTLEYYSPGGAIYTREGSVTITSSTLTDNSTAGDQSDGGGIFVANTTEDAQITIENSIVAGNAVGAGSTGADLAPDPEGALTIGYSLIGDNAGTTLAESQTPDADGNLIGSAAGGGIIDAMLGPLDDYGGPTLTHILVGGSPAIDAGDPNVLFDLNEFDQRGNGFPRVQFGRIDMGAVELNDNDPPTGLLVVDTPADVVDGDYSQFNFSLREAIERANDFPGPDTISFAPSVFAGPVTIALSLGELEITEELTITGPGQELLTIDAQQNSRVINFTASAGDLTLQGVTLRNGKTTGNHANYSANTYSGGGIRFLSAGTLTLTRSVVSANNTAGDRARGGGVYAPAGDVTLVESAVDGNSTAGVFGRGGGIHIGTGVLTLADSSVSGNSTTGFDGYGSGIFSAGGDVALTDSTVSGNIATGGLGDGGGIFAGGGDVTLIRSTLSDNRNGNAVGGGIRLFGGDLTLIDSTLSGNSSGGSGGGIHSFDGIILISNSTISGNSSEGNGGGIYLSGGALTLIGSTVTANSATDEGARGGGIYFVDVASNPPITILNSIVAGNTVGPGGTSPDLRRDPDGTFVNEYSLIGGDPLLAPLDDNGGPTQTHALLPGSPAINTGDPTLEVDPNEFDQRGAGFPRVRLGHVDIGAYEFYDLTPPAGGLVVSTTDDVFDGDYSPLNLSLREAIALANNTPGADAITFDTSAFATPQIINLELGELEITETVAITGTGQELTTIDAQQNSRVINFTASTGDLTLEGVTLQNGRTNGNGFNDSTSSGGGVRFESEGELTVIDSQVSGNSTAGQFARGGGIFSATGAVSIVDSIVSENSTGGEYGAGGGVFAHSGTLTLTNSRVSGNRTLGPDFSPGGGIYTRFAAVIVTNTVVAGNSTTGVVGHGGGIYSSLGVVSLLDSSIRDNGVEGQTAFGGGIMTVAGDVLVMNSAISGNSSSEIGGGIHTMFGDVTIANSIISRNISGFTGGGIDALFGNVSLTNSTLSSNRSKRGGGGIVVGEGALILSRSTVTLNSADRADANGGGIFVGNSATDQPILITNSIVAGNDIAPGGASPDLHIPPGRVSNISYSLIGGDSLLGPLADNRGPTQTHALLPGSPALNAGDPSFEFNAFEHDQRGVGYSRVALDRIDIGAYEAQTTPSADFVDDGVIRGSDFLAWQRGFGITTGATRADGNSNDDGDVDASDLAAWEVSFGQVESNAIAFAASSDDASVTQSHPLAASPEPALGLAATLVDAALNDQGSEATVESHEFASETPRQRAFAKFTPTRRGPLGADFGDIVVRRAEVPTAKPDVEKISGPVFR